MKFTVSQSSLTQAIGVVMKGVASASTLPILSGVLVKAQDGILEFQTSNYTISIRHRIAAHVEEEGEMVIPCKMLSNITKTLPDAPVTFELSERQVLIGCEKSSFRLNTLDANDFPEFPAYAIESAVELPTDVLSEMVGRVWRVTSTDKARPILGGVHMKVENNTVRLVATDSFRLAVCDTQVETSTLEGSFELNVPADAFNDALSIMASQATIMIGATDTQVVFEAGNTTYVSRRIEGAYPNYKQLIPDSCVTSVKIDVAAFNAALKRVAVIASANPAVKFEIDVENGQMGLSSISNDQDLAQETIDVENGQMGLSSISNDQDLAQETIDVEAEGESGTIAFNYHYIFGCLNALSKEKEITLELKSYSQAGIFKSYDKINYLYLVMPVRI